MMLVLAIVLAVSAVSVLTYAVRSTRGNFVANADEFVDTIRKLIFVGDFDRAIKLCNSTTTILTLGIKALLIRASRPHELELVYQERRLALQVFRAFLVYKKSVHFGLLIGGCLATAFMVLVVDSAADGVAVSTSILLTVYVLATYAATSLISQQHINLAEYERHLVAIRNEIYRRAGVVPAHLKPRDENVLSSDEFKAWRNAMNAFNEDYTRRKGEGEAVGTPQEEYDKQADEDGVLPSL